MTQQVGDVEDVSLPLRENEEWTPVYCCVKFPFPTAIGISVLLLTGVGLVIFGGSCFWLNNYFNCGSQSGAIFMLVYGICALSFFTLFTVAVARKLGVSRHPNAIRLV